MIKRLGKTIIGSLMLLMLSGCQTSELLQEIPRNTHITISTQDAANEQEDTAIAYSFLSENIFPYSYHQLTEAEQSWYRDIERALGSMLGEVILSREGFEDGLEEEDIDRIFQSVLNDHPEIFYVEGYTCTKYIRGLKVVDISFSGTYSMDVEAAMGRQQEIEQAADAMLAGIDMSASDYDKVKYVYDTIIRHTDYNLDAPDNQNIYSVFVGRSSVCQGYAQAAQYLLNLLEVDCTLVQGYVDTDERHAWNMIYVDGASYFMDVTWGDASYRTEDGREYTGGYPEINYDYLCVTTNQLLTTHQVDNCVPVPQCTETAANYYVRENALFYYYDKGAISQLFIKAKENGRTDVTIKCANTNCYQEISKALVDNQEIFNYFPVSSTQVSYACNESTVRSFFLLFPNIGVLSILPIRYSSHTVRSYSASSEVQ